VLDQLIEKWEHGPKHTELHRDDPPELPTAGRHIPPALARIVDRCLEKNPAARFQSTRDLAFALEGLSAHSDVQPAVIAESGSQKTAGILWKRLALAAAGILCVTLPFTALHLRESVVEPVVTKFRVDLPEGAALPGGLVGTPYATIAVSPDGRRFVVAVGSAEGTRLMMRSIDSVELVPIPGTEDVQSFSFPSFSPDGRFIAFMAGGKLKKAELIGGSAQTISDLPKGGFGEASWSGDGVIVFSQPFSGLFRVAASGGEPAQLTKLDTSRGETFHRSPSFLPDGRHFLYMRGSGSSAGLYVGSLDSEDAKLLMNGTSNASYAPPGYVLFVRERVLFAQQFDEEALALEGERLSTSWREFSKTCCPGQRRSRCRGRESSCIRTCTLQILS
jgi:hypothetical protein